MKWIHTSDLHIGRYLNEFSLLEDQRFFLAQLENLAQEHHIDALLLAGDLYDRSVPSAEAVEVLNRFLTKMTQQLQIPVLAIAGNHDSPQRLDFCSALLEHSGLYIASSYKAEIKKVTLQDDFGPVHFYLLPYLEPGEVRGFFEEEIKTFDDAYRLILKENEKIFDPTARNVILSHGFFSYHKDPDATVRTASEVSLGGADLIDARIFESFDYAALGHIHRPQKAGKDHLLYSGSPLKYSLSEVDGKKSVHLVELKEKRNLTITPLTYPVLRDLRIIRGRFDELTETLPVNGQQNDLVYFSLTDDVLVPGAMNRLRSIYPAAIGLGLEKELEHSPFYAPENYTVQSTDELFAQFYEMITGETLDGEKKEIILQTKNESEQKRPLGEMS